MGAHDLSNLTRRINSKVSFMNKYFASLLGIPLILATIEASACSCLVVPEKQQFHEASNVFVGTVVETKLFTNIKKVDDLTISTENVSAKVKIVQPIKGDSAQHIEVIDAVADGANCGIGLLTGRDYLFYLSDDNAVSLCDGTRLYNEFTDTKLIEKMRSY